MTSKRLLAFAKAWDAKDLEKIMAFFTEDCRYSPSVVGEKKTYQGKDEVRLAIAAMIALDNTVVSRVQNININGAFGCFGRLEGTKVKANPSKIDTADLQAIQAQQKKQLH